MLLVTCWHHLRQALDHHWLLVLWAVQKQQAVVAATWGAAFLLVCAATIAACSDNDAIAVTVTETGSAMGQQPTTATHGTRG
jgi:hypothetical protein